jgi:hypothetical protein
MPDNHKLEIEKLDKKTSQLLVAISKAEHGNTEVLKEFLKNIHRPGWTTPAEIAFVNLIIDNINAQYASLNTLVNCFVKATGMVESR